MRIRYRSTHANALNDISVRKYSPVARYVKQGKRCNEINSDISEEQKMNWGI